MFIVFITLILIVFLIPAKAQAIIFLPALILIPVAKIVAVIIGGLSIPALGLGALWSKLFGKSLAKTILTLLFILVSFALIVGFILKMINPQRQLF